MMMCALYNFASLRSIKDSLVVSNIGAESISFLKLWLVFPSAVIFTIIYMKISNKLTHDKVFYLITLSFLSFFLIFSLYLYPNKDIFHPSGETIKRLSLEFPNFKWFIKILGSWTFALMYIFSELWSVVIINLMFWQFANHIVDSDKTKRFYPLFGLIGNFGIIIAGSAMIYFSNIASVNSDIIFVANYKGAGEADIGLKLSIFSVVFVGFIMIGLMFYINKFVLKEKEYKKKNDSTVTKLSLLDSLKLILSSKYIVHITIIIICYGLAINVLEGPWKAKIRELHPGQQEYLAFMGRFNVWLGISCVTFMIIGSNILRSFSWKFSALVTPVVIGITGFMFFTFVIFSNLKLGLDKFLFDPLVAAVFVGGLQNILSKSIKYSLFDSTKEMAYRPLSIELKTKGKAAAEVIGAKFGKSLGAVIQSSMFILMPSSNFADVTPILFSFFLIVIFIWILNVMFLSSEYEKISKE